MAHTIAVSDTFRQRAWGATLAILLFVFTYLTLLLLALGLTLILALLGIGLIILKPTFITLMLGAGVGSMGILILTFLVKFMFKQHKVDRSHLVEISRSQEPTLFAVIDEIVKEVQTDFPKKIYLSADVNAAVFYDSSFWSMFLPIRKNLQIGLGLVNSVSADEFRAILAHEFGHFSQRSMKVGSYVYHVNQVIFNMLYDNESYGELAQRWANVSGYFVPFVKLAIKVVGGIQWVLQKVYEVVNLSYMKLSREMEFHADQVAAHVTGSSPLISSLLRLELADYSFQTVLGYYNQKIGEAVRTPNIYPRQQFVMGFIARESELPIEHELPQVSVEHTRRYNKSRLVISNQWASHPSTEDRTEALKRLDIRKESYDKRPATAVFTHIQELQNRVTDQLFSSVTYKAPVTLDDQGKFIEEFTRNYESSAFPKIFHGYYDNHHPLPFDVALESQAPVQPAADPETLFSDTAKDSIYLSAALENDVQALRKIAEGNTGIKTFEYDGHKYKPEEIPALIPKLETEQADTQAQIARNDQDIFHYFLSQARELGEEDRLLRAYEALFTAIPAFDEKMKAYSQVVNECAFFHQTLEFSFIEQHMQVLKKSETPFKDHIRDLLNGDHFQPDIQDEARKAFEKYLSREWLYFLRPNYDEFALEVLTSALRQYQQVVSQYFLRTKKEMLSYQERIWVNSPAN